MRAGMAWEPTRHMLIERSLMPQFLSNTYLVGDARRRGRLHRRRRPRRAPRRAAERQGLTPTHVLLTHHHHDHVAELGALRERWPGITVLAHPDEAALVEGDVRPITPGEPLEVAGLRIAPLHTPGHTSGMLELPRPGQRLHRRHAVQGLGRRRARAGPHDLRGPAPVDHGRPPGAARRRPSSGPATPTPRPSPTSSRPTPSSGSGAASTPRATSRPPPWASPRRSCCSATTTTAATRRGSAGRTGATTSCPAPRSQRTPTHPG